MESIRKNGIVTLLKGIETGDPLSVEVFRFENDMAVEHWDNIQLRRGQNNSNYSMVNGPTEVKDLDKTEGNRNIVITVSLVSWFVFFWASTRLWWNRYACSTLPANIN